MAPTTSGVAFRDRIRQLLLSLSRQQVVVAWGLFGGRLGGFLTGAVAARALGPERFAIYTVGFTVFASLMQLTSFADTWLVSRWGEVEVRPSAKRAVWEIKLWTALGTTAVAALIGVLIPELIARFRIGAPALTIAVAAAGAAALTTAVASTYQADLRFAGYAAIVAACPLLGAVLTALLAAFGVRDPAWFLLAILASYAPVAVAARRRLATPSPSPHYHSLLREALRFGGWVTIGSLAYVLFQRVDVFLLAALAPPETVGSYGVAARLATIAAVFGNTITTVLMPAGSRKDTWASPAARREYVTASIVSIAATVALVGVGIYFIPWVIRVVFGTTYLSAAGPARILLLGQAVIIAQMPFYFALYAFNGGRWIAALGLAQLAIAAGAGYLLVARYGASGAAWSNTITYASGALVVAAFHLRRARRWRAAA